MSRFAIICTLLLLAAKGPTPTQNGDAIGTATMLPDKSVSISLRSVECDGTIAEAQFVVSPDEARYTPIVDQYEVRAVGETKQIIARDSQPCRRKGR